MWSSMSSTSFFAPRRVFFFHRYIYIYVCMVPYLYTYSHIAAWEILTTVNFDIAPTIESKCFRNLTKNVSRIRLRHGSDRIEYPLDLENQPKTAGIPSLSHWIHGIMHPVSWLVALNGSQMVKLLVLTSEWWPYYNYAYYLYGGPPKNLVTSLCFKPMFWDLYTCLILFGECCHHLSNEKTWVGWVI